MRVLRLLSPLEVEVVCLPTGAEGTCVTGGMSCVCPVMGRGTAGLRERLEKMQRKRCLCSWVGPSASVAAVAVSG